MKRLIARIAAGASLLSALACGSLVSNADQPGTLASVAGTVSNPDALPIENRAFRVAVGWVTSGQELADGGYADDHRTTQDVAVSPVFPARFTVALSQFPPVLQPIQELFGAAPSVALRGVAGFVLAYEDLNHNGQLDLVTAASSGFVDRVVGEANMPLFYLEGTVPSDPSLWANAQDASGKLPSLGFNLFETYCVSGKVPPAGETCDVAFDWVPVSMPVAIALSGDPKLSNLMCAEIPSGGSSETSNTHSPGDFPPTFPFSSDPKVACTPDGRSFTYKACATSSPPGTCQPSWTICSEDTYVLVSGAPAPSGWPCTAK